MPRRPARLALTATALFGAAAAGFTYAAYRQDLARAHARIATGSAMARTPVGPIEYALAGSGPSLLVVHGAGGGFDQGMSFGQAFADRFHVIAMSRFGYLRTLLQARASAESQADAHAALLDALDIEEAAVIGISAGAPSAIQFALRHPQRTRALVLLVPATYVPRPGKAASVTTPPLTVLFSFTALRSDLLYWSATKLARDAVIRAVLATPPEQVATASSEEQARVQRMLDLILPVSARRRGLMQDGFLCSTLPRYALEHIAAPTLAISLEDDLYGTYDGARYSAAHIPGARFVGYRSGGHLWVGHQRDVIDDISAFLQQHSSRRTFKTQTRHGRTQSL